eukprot:gene11824-biopygen836
MWWPISISPTAAVNEPAAGGGAGWCGWLFAPCHQGRMEGEGSSCHDTECNDRPRNGAEYEPAIPMAPEAGVQRVRFTAPRVTALRT